MAISDLWRGKKEDPAPLRTVSVSDMLEGGKYQLEYVNDESGQQFAIVTERRAGVLDGEYGTSSPSPWTSWTREEYNSQLRGQKGLQVYDKMRRSDGGVRGTLRAAKTPVLAASWFIEPGGDKDIDKKAADWVWKNLTSEMSTPWMQTLTEALLMLDFGYYMFEKVWENRVVDGELRTVLKKLGPRHPMDVKSWHFDRNGGPDHVCMYPADQGNLSAPDIKIPIQKMLVFSFDKEAGNIEGMSILRSAYKHWYYKEQLYKIDAIQKERHGIGIPIIKLPLGYTEKDKAAAQNLGRNVRTNERAHVVLPPGWDLMMLKLEGQPVDCLASVDHHDIMIRMNILSDFLSDDGSGSDKTTMFLKATRFIADILADTFNAYLIPEMTQYNFAHAAVPKLKVRRIGESADWRTLSFAIRNLIGAGVIIPDQELEDNIRDEMDLPPADHDTSRLLATPQNPFDSNEDDLAAEEEGDGTEDEIDNRADDQTGSNDGTNTRNNNNPLYNRRKKGKKQRGARAGLPRQATTNRQRGTGAGGTGSNTGTDRSGG
jgi:hypothetical protein